jgi:hypothetical protein
VEALSQEEKPDMDLLLSKLNDKSLSIIEFADAANHIIVAILHKAGEEILSIASSETNHPRSAHAGYHSSSDSAEANCQKRIQVLKDRLRGAPISTPQPSLDEMVAQLRRERQNLDRLTRHQLKSGNARNRTIKQKKSPPTEQTAAQKSSSSRAFVS